MRYLLLSLLLLVCRPLVGCDALARIATPKAPVIILSGPSGAGKTTVLQRVIEEAGLPLRTAVAVTTRDPRPGEVDGVHYHFWTKAQYTQAVQNGEFLESTEVHGNFYGTLKSEVDPYREQGIGVVLVIDVQGARKVKAQVSDAASVFLKTSSIATYEARLRARGTESEASIAKRVSGAKEELKAEAEYDRTVLNDNLDEAVKDLSAFVRSRFGAISP